MALLLRHIRHYRHGQRTSNCPQTRQPLSYRHESRLAYRGDAIVGLCGITIRLVDFRSVRGLWGPLRHLHGNNLEGFPRRRLPIRRDRPVDPSSRTPRQMVGAALLRVGFLLSGEFQAEFAADGGSSATLAGRPRPCYPPCMADGDQLRTRGRAARKRTDQSRNRMLSPDSLDCHFR